MARHCQLANELESIALGQSYSTRTLQLAVGRLERLRAEWKASEPEIDPIASQRLFESIIACKSALLGWTGGTHEIQDAARFIRHAELESPSGIDLASLPRRH